MALSPGDPNSYSRPDQMITSNIHLDWDVDFDSKVVSGVATITFKKFDLECSTLLLDVNMLDIKSVKYNSSSDLKYSVGPAGPCGSKLEVTLPQESNSTFSVSISYLTSRDSPALLWLTPEQTAGKKHPYLFSQGQAILNRALFPCQDSPAVKAPYTATVKAPSALTVLMSAIRDGDPVVMEDNKSVHKFTQKVPIQSYLVAFAIGALESRKIGPRSHVWSEAEFVDKAAFDFSETETMLKTAEELCGPYVWGIYDILVLPPSFAYGGMENPCLTFATPTLLTGDKSNADVIAHEIAHSWTGNLVTNNTFEHFWLNEGFTVFTERKIKGRMQGEAVRHFTALLRWKELEETVNKVFSPSHPYTKLVPDLTGVDPDDAFSRIPYEKGSTFLWYLEDLVGGAANFEPFLKAYYTEFAYKSIDTDAFKMYFLQYFSGEPGVSEIDWDTWLHKPGMPPYKPKFDPSLAEACWKLASQWQAWDTSSDLPFNGNEIQTFSPTQVQEFLGTLLIGENLTNEKLENLNTLYGFSKSSNYEILFLWLRLGLKSRWEPAVEATFAFLRSMGRGKFVRPLYRDLASWDQKKEETVAFFHKNKKELMAGIVDAVNRDLGIV